MRLWVNHWLNIWRFRINVMEIEITPNRGDCLSIAGMAREVAAIYRMQVKHRGRRSEQIARINSRWHSRHRKRCPLYRAVIIKGLRADAATPAMDAERLRRSGMRAIHPVVDVTQYVMLELGQPMHAYDLKPSRRRHRGAHGRKEAESLSCSMAAASACSGRTGHRRHKQVKALAGIMGGDESSVTAGTTDIFLKAAFFTPAAIGWTAARFGLPTDASLSF